MRTKLLFCLLALQSILLYSQDNIKMMFYNVLNYPSINQVGRTPHLTTILNNYQPDILAVCELNNITGAADILSILQGFNPSYQSVSFVTNSSDDSNGDSNSLQQLVFYNSSKVILETQHTPLATTLRDINHYTFKLNASDVATNPYFFDVYVTHLKASSGSSNETIRKNMVDVFTADLANLPNDRAVIFAGDLNMYNSSEPANVELLDPTNDIVLFDPVNRQGNWHNNSSYLDVFTQSTNTTGINGGASGGFDDRFDFIYLSQNMQSTNELSYKAGSYQAFGNNNNPSCWNSSINSSDCSGATYDFTIRDALYNFSDHLPVVLELETNKTLTVPSELLIENFISFTQGNIVTNQLQLQINNENLKNETISIFNNLGQIVYEENIESRKNISINVSHLSSGIYYIRTSKHLRSTLKFLKNN